MNVFRRLAVLFITCNTLLNTGLKIMAGQRTMSGLIVDLTGQTLILPVIFGWEPFKIFSI